MEATRERYPPIASYALLSDCHGSALVSRDGSIDWCCLPRFDARPVFARLLDWHGGGHFSIRPVTGYDVSRRYVHGTNILETRFRTASGTLLLTDFMAIGRIDPEEDPLYDEPVARATDRLMRIARVEEGSVETRVEYRPRFDFGATVPYTSAREDDLLVTYGGADALVLQTPVRLAVGEADATGTRVLNAGDELCFVLSYQLPHQLRPERVGEADVRGALEETRRYWVEWSERCDYDGAYRDAVVRSALVLKALTNLPTGAIVAAPTTSLPEEIGGVRNWDYRYTWLRDAAHVLDSLFYLGYVDEAEAFIRWLNRTTAGRPEQLQIMYGVGGERLLPEVEVPGLDGYRASRPVRVGNAAARQFQLDIFGDLLHVASRHHARGGQIGGEVWSVLRGMVDHVVRVWDRADHGLWEVRSEPRHFVHSKVMAWVALDRGIELADDTGCPADLETWKATRGAIRECVLAHGVDADMRIRRAFDLPYPDASSLLLPLLGFLPFDDERVVRTREWVIEQLGEQGLLYRYLGPDGLPGSEAAFVACSFWLVEHLARAGEVERAERIFGGLLDLANDVGLLPEEVEPGTGEFLGNFPQALSHIGLINAAVALDKAH